VKSPLRKSKSPCPVLSPHANTFRFMPKGKGFFSPRVSTPASAMCSPMGSSQVYLTIQGMNLVKASHMQGGDIRVSLTVGNHTQMVCAFNSISS
jgi:hypothetical protein